MNRSLIWPEASRLLHGRRLHLLLILVLFVAGCSQSQRRQADDGIIRIVATTSMIADAVRAVVGEHAEVVGLMGPGVDPHLYKASEGDVARMSEADLIFYNGLHLEGKMAELFGRISGRGIEAVAIADAIPEDLLISTAVFPGNYDPHIWFDVSIWSKTVVYIGEVMANADSANALAYRTSAEVYVRELADLEDYIRGRSSELDPHMRVLVTAHDAFGYFGRAYGFEVRGLQGLSTASEAGTADVQELASFIAERRIPALFVETSVPVRSIEAVRKAVQAKGFDVEVGGNLFSDALGSPGTPAATYTGTFKHNIDTIVNALSGVSRTQ